jgi:hypothetical protein
MAGCFSLFFSQINSQRRVAFRGKPDPPVVPANDETARYLAVPSLFFAVPEPASTGKVNLPQTDFGDPFLSYSFDNHTGAMYNCQCRKENQV